MPRLVKSVIVGTESESNRDVQTVKVLESLLQLAFRVKDDGSVMVRSSLAMATGELLVFLVGLEGDDHSRHDQHALVLSTSGRISGDSGGTFQFLFSLVSVLAQQFTF